MVVKSAGLVTPKLLQLKQPQQVEQGSCSVVEIVQDVAQCEGGSI